jgi:hypothetical protein
MTDNENERKPEETGETKSSTGGEAASNYFTQLTALFKRPDEFFADTYHGQKLFGLINLVALVVIIALAGFVQRAGYGGVDFGDLLGGIKSALALAIPLAAVLFLYPWYAKQQGRELSLDFMLEKLGGAVALSAILILLAIPLNLLDITLHSWFHGAGRALVYIAVFMTAYWYVAPNRLAVATISVVAFYFAYRLIGLIL